MSLLKIKAHTEYPFWWQLEECRLYERLEPIFAVSFNHDYLLKNTNQGPRVWHCGRQAFDCAQGFEFLTNKLFHAFVWGISDSGLRFSCSNLKNVQASWEAQGFSPSSWDGSWFLFS